MSGSNLKIWAQIEALKIRASAMLVANYQRHNSGMAMAYNEDAFMKLHDEIANLAMLFQE